MIKLEMITTKESAEMANGNEQILQEMSNKLRQWLQQQPYLPQKISDKRLQYTLLSTKLDLEKAKKRLDSLYTLHNLLPEFFADYDPLVDSIAHLYKIVEWVYLPKLSPEKYRVSVARWVTDDISTFHPQHTMKYLFMLLDIRAEEDMVNSEIVLWDCKYLVLGHILKYTPSLLKKYELCLMAYGSRIKAIYIINAPVYVELLLSLLKKVLKPKFFDRIHVCGYGIESLNGAIPKSILPVDYGGDELSMKTLTDMWNAKLMAQRDWLLAQGKLRTDENLRRDTIINPDDFFGVAGIFKQLEVD